jgi:nucleotide-binding universal stress UspA family protein
MHQTAILTSTDQHAGYTGQQARLNEEALMKTILVPLDGSILAEQALPYARMLAHVLNAHIQLLRVVPDIERESLLVDSLATMYVGEIAASYQERDQQILQGLREHAETYLDAQQEQLRMSGVEIGTTVRIGPPAEIIVEVATHLDTAMIVMATHGYSGLQRWAIGSVADKVVHATHTPVLLVRSPTTPILEEPRLERIIVPLDGSALSRQALPIAAELAQHAQAQVILMHAIDPLAEAYPSAHALSQSLAHPDRLLHEMVETAGHQLGQVAGTLTKDSNVTVTPMALIGYPAEVIVDEAERRHASLIVMATHGYSGLRRWTLGSTADKVLHSTRTPLLIIRATHN